MVTVVCTTDSSAPVLILGVTEGTAVLGVGQLGLRDRCQAEDMGEGPEGPHLLQRQGLDVCQTRSGQRLYAHHRHVSVTQTQSLSMQAQSKCKQSKSTETKVSLNSNTSLYQHKSSLAKQTQSLSSQTQVSVDINTLSVNKDLGLCQHKHWSLLTKRVSVNANIHFCRYKHSLLK